MAVRGESTAQSFAREAVAEEARAFEIAAASKRKPLGKAEQQEFVRRVQGYAAKRQANQADALKKLEEEANKTANSPSGGASTLADHVMQRLAPKSLAAGRLRHHPRKGGAGFPSIPTTAGHGGAGGAPATPRTSAMQKVEAGKMLAILKWPCYTQRRGATDPFHRRPRARSGRRCQRPRRRLCGQRTSRSMSSSS